MVRVSSWITRSGKTPPSARRVRPPAVVTIGEGVRRLLEGPAFEVPGDVEGASQGGHPVARGDPKPRSPGRGRTVWTTPFPKVRSPRTTARSWSWRDPATISAAEAVNRSTRTTRVLSGIRAGSRASHDSSTVLLGWPGLRLTVLARIFPTVQEEVGHGKGLDQVSAGVPPKVQDDSLGIRENRESRVHLVGRSSGHLVHQDVSQGVVDHGGGTAETWTWSLRMGKRRGSGTPSRSILISTTVPDGPRMESRAISTVQFRASTPFTSTILSPTTRPAWSAGVWRNTAVMVTRSLSWVIWTPIPA